MIDSGATALFISHKFVQKNNVRLQPLAHAIKLSNIDGSQNKAGSLTHYARLQLTVGAHTEITEFLVTNLGPEDVVLGLPWLKRVNPTIDWEKGEMDIPGSPDNESSSPVHKIQANREERRQWLRAGILEDTTDELWCYAGYTLSTKLAAEKNLAKDKQTFEQMVPPQYRQYKKVFSEEESHRLPQHQPWDHTIDLKSDAPETLRSKVYPMPLNEQQELDNFIQENLAKGYIRHSQSPMASPFFFVKKKDGSLRPVQDYRALNEGTVRNAYPLPLISALLDKLKSAKIFTKLDVRAGYNNVRIKDGDQ